MNFPLREESFFIELSADERLRVRLRLGRGRVEGFVVQLETWIDDWVPVVRYDCAHGHPHKDIFLSNGRKEKIWLSPGSMEDLVNVAIDDLKGNWKEYRRRCGYEKG